MRFGGIPVRSVLLACGLTACGPAGGASPAPAPTPAPAPAPSRSERIITADEIAASHATTAFHAVLLLRGQLLNIRGPASFAAPDAARPTVYVDNVEYGDVGALRLIPATDVDQIRFLSAWDATTKYGGRHRGGVIEVTTKH